MKLKGLKDRAYNILFHTHTVAGIVISFSLFIIFYAGSFALFKYEMYRWENPAARIPTPAVEHLDFSRAISAVKTAKPGFVEQEQFTIRLPKDELPFAVFYGTEQTEAGEEERFAALVNVSEEVYTAVDHEEEETTVGETLYHLHFFDQIPGGLYISGLVSLFFLFATFTGLLIHWRNLLTKFYAFTVKGKWKQIWTNAHTVLGVIGLPFQIVYAVTGAFFGLLIVLLIPSALVLFGGDADKVYEAVRPETAIPVDPDAPEVQHASLSVYYDQVTEMYPDIPVLYMSVRNYGREDGLASYYFDDYATLSGTGQVTFELNSGRIANLSEPYNRAYTQSVLALITKLHFGTFGGILLKVIYFMLGMITCFMILSGVLLWQQARNNNRYTEKQKRFHHRVTKVYLAICLSMFPAVALIFLANKLVPMELAGRAFYVNAVFFGGWLLLTLAGLFWNDFRQLNRNYLVMGAGLSLLIPVVNGLVTGDWIWSALAGGQGYVASVDIFWLMTGVLTFVALRYMPNRKGLSTVQEDERPGAAVVKEQIA